jgi:two-component system CheB/CheR fusion protein
LDLFDQLPAGIFVTSPLGEILAVNRKGAGMVGYSIEELVGRNVSLVTVPEDEAHRAADRARGRPPGTTIEKRRRMLRKDGSVVVGDGKALVLADGLIFSIVFDVTASADTERDLFADAERLRFLANAVPALISYVDTDARYLWVNESYRSWFGQSPEELRGRHASEVLGEQAFEVVRPYVERALGGEPVSYDRWLVFKDGAGRFVRASYVPHFDAEGKVRGFVTLVHDMTEIRQAEHALRRSEYLLDCSQSTAHVGSWEVLLAPAGPSAPGQLRWSNEAYRIFGYEPGNEVTLAKFYECVHPDDRERVRAEAAAGTRRGEPFEKEYRIVRPDGTERVVHAWTQFEHDATGKPIRMIGTCQDVTKQRDAERELRQARENLQAVIQELRDADRRKDEFLAMLSHELRNPLAPILNAVEVLDRAAPHDEAARAKYRAVIGRQVQHMKHLLDDLLDVSRVSQGKIQLRKERVELGALLLQAVEVSRPIIVEKRQQLSMTLAPGPLPLDADPTRLVQVFANLLNNAAKYTDAGGHITLSVTAAESEVVVSVRDDGMGMSPELLVRAFDLFVQETRSLDRAQGGLGIGLTMVRTLVKMHGGSVHALSEGPGCGSELVVTLPLATVAAGEAGEGASRGKAAPANEARASERALRVLVVDDNVDAADAIGTLLEVLGHDVTLAYDGPGALAAAAAAPPELVLLDIGLPGMDGYAVAARLRAAGHDRAMLVALTGYGQDDHLRRTTEAGFDHHLVKPLDFDTLGGITARLRAGPAGAKHGKD